MKKTLIILSVCLLLLAGCGKNDGNSVVGTWIDTETESIVEFTKDGYYKEGFTQDVWQEPTKYVIDGNKIIRYVESDRQATEFSVTYEITDEGHLIINDILEYKPMELKTESEE